MNRGELPILPENDRVRVSRFAETLAGTIEKLDLKKPVYAQTAVGGHFGKDFLAWELVDKAEEISNAVNKG